MTPMIDLSQQPFPLRLLRVRQIRANIFDPMLDGDLTSRLEHPAMSASEREASTERLLYARRRNSSPA